MLHHFDEWQIEQRFFRNAPNCLQPTNTKAINVDDGNRLGITRALFLENLRYPHFS